MFDQANIPCTLIFLAEAQNCTVTPEPFQIQLNSLSLGVERKLGLSLLLFASIPSTNFPFSGFNISIEGVEIT